MASLWRSKEKFAQHKFFVLPYKTWTIFLNFRQLFPAKDIGQSLLMVLMRPQPILFPEFISYYFLCVQYVSHCNDFTQQNLDLYSNPWNELTSKKQTHQSFLFQNIRYIVHVRVKYKLKLLLQTWSNGFSKSWKSPSSSQFLKNLVGVGVWSTRSDRKNVE